MEIAIWITLVLSLVAVVKGARLSRSIADFDVLNYDTNHLHRQHKRAINSPLQHRVELNFDAFGRNFQLHLKPDDSVFSDDMVLVTAGGTYPKHYLDEVHFYKGEIADVPGSFVHGSIKDGLFQGRVHSKNERYSIEPAHRYVNDTTQFHSVIYNDKDVDFPKHPSGNCGVTDEIQKRMTEKLKVADASSNVEGHYRQKRQTPNTRQTCGLHIITDHVFYARYMDNNEILRQMGEHVQAATEVFSGHEFTAQYTEIQFGIERITLYDNEDIGRTAYPFDSDFIGSEKFLDIASSIDGNTRYCLVFAFTNRDFANGVLGLAWISVPSSPAGGVCSTSFNAGIVTTNNYGENVSPVVSHLTFAHELGHSFGSRHDPDGNTACTPGGSAGNYLMFAHASAGDLPNNNEFSTCSISNISRVLNSIGSVRLNCFKELDEIQLCGNLIIEPGEQCDCGFGNNTCGSNCCNPDCTLDGVCSPQQGVCCGNLCGFSGTSQVCAEETECSERTFCVDNDAVCPVPVARNNGQPCDEGRRVCDAGACDKSICTVLSREPCQCTEEANHCVICCVDEVNNNVCTPFHTLNDSNVVKFMDTGSPCGNFMGYCDVFDECRLAQEDGPIAGIIRSIFPSDEVQLYDAVLSWVTTNWWIVLLAVLFTIGLMALIMFLCNLCIPTDNPWKEEVQSAKRNRVNLRNRRSRGSQYPTGQPRDDEKISAF